MAVIPQDIFRAGGKAETFKFGRGRGLLLAVGAFLLGSVLLLGCQPTQPAATPQPGEKAVTAAVPTKVAEKAVVTPAKAAEKPVRGGTLRIATYANYTTLDPQADQDTTISGLAFESYIYRNEEFEVTKEGLFKDWSTSPDGKALTFKLREGVRFHDGTDFDAAAVKFNIERVKDPETKSPYRTYFASVASVEVVDSLTARFNLSRPDALLLSALGSRGGLVVSPAAVKKYGQDFGRNPVGTGPFQFVEWKFGDHSTLKRFDGYWKKDKDGNQLPYMDGVVFRIIPDATVAATSLRVGESDVFMLLPAAQVPVLEKDPNLSLVTNKSVTVSLVVINTNRPPFDNKALREAVAYAVDRQGIASITGGKATGHGSIMVPAFLWAYDPKAGLFPDRDVAKAKAKMAEAGYPGGGGLKVSLPTYSADPTAYNSAQVLQANLKEIGIEAELQVIERAAWANLLMRDAEAKFQIMIGFTPSGNPEVGDAFNVLYHSQGSRNALGPYSNPEVDRLIEKAGSIYDQKERAALYQQAARLIREDVPVVPLVLNPQTMGTNKRVRNISYTVVYAANNHAGFREAWLAQ